MSICKKQLHNSLDINTILLTVNAFIINDLIVAAVSREAILLDTVRIYHFYNIPTVLVGVRALYNNPTNRATAKKKKNAHQEEKLYESLAPQFVCRNGIFMSSGKANGLAQRVLYDQVIYSKKKKHRK